MGQLSKDIDGVTEPIIADNKFLAMLAAAGKSFQRISIIKAINGIYSLLDLGVDITIEDASGKTLLHWAVDNNHTEAVELLLKNGASKDIKDKEGRNAVQIAEKKQNKEIEELLKR